MDLDGTLARYEGWQGVEHIGEPIPAMLARVKQWLAEGVEVRIFTARVWNSDPTSVDVFDTVSIINTWCEKHLGQRLKVTCQKDFGMVELWDDRCVQVVMNTGIRADGQR